MKTNLNNNKLKQILKMKKKTHKKAWLFLLQFEFVSGLDSKLEDVGNLLLLITKLFICDLVYGQWNKLVPRSFESR